MVLYTMPGRSYAFHDVSNYNLPFNETADSIINSSQIFNTSHVEHDDTAENHMPTGIVFLHSSLVEALLLFAI